MEKERKLKLIWDFKGPDAATTARHHAVHLQEYRKTRNLSLDHCGSEKIGDAHAIAYLVVTEKEMPEVRDQLKPHRGQLFEK
ncbi:hypothetical protein [Salinimicrobium oceani]|uniref:YCII-related domain-containing protein n=1 Tax=Salinimicrobium oceani TaxID=2722702 RepID=A0ABX1D5G1_9FLAO|nr:hypothetical protein [Salinimicrobium oceani]NJW53993.1 hypothetical protein [Salinimicrobium oceani]